MKIILTKDLENLGKAGALVEVKPGYGRNYLLPRGMAVAATAKNIRQLDHEKAGILSRASKHRSNMDAQAKKLASVELRFSRKVGEQEKLFGSVTSKDIHEQLAGQGYAGWIGCEYKPNDPADSSTSFAWREPDEI